jgi:hypothetical protein
MYEEIAHKIRELPSEEPCSSYEWEELVQKLCVSADAGLRAIGARELDILRQKYPRCPILRDI